MIEANLWVRDSKNLVPTSWALQLGVESSRLGRHKWFQIFTGMRWIHLKPDLFVSARISIKKHSKFHSRQTHQLEPSSYENSARFTWFILLVCLRARKPQFAGAFGCWELFEFRANKQRRRIGRRHTNPQAQPAKRLKINNQTIGPLTSLGHNSNVAARRRPQLSPTCVRLLPILKTDVSLMLPN